MKKLFSLVLCMLLLCACFSGCGRSADTGKVVVCFDIANYNGSVSTKSAVNSFLGWVDDCHQYLDLSISSEVS
ncbi:MAG: hypothetical protein J1E06_00375, partial [Acutalibacter sp.]|nr:hypothetical protein [Acutalibacter sp.]